MLEGNQRREGVVRKLAAFRVQSSQSSESVMTKSPFLIAALYVMLPVASAQNVLHQLDGSKEYDFLGWTVAGAGDVDADGFDDLVVGMLGYNSLGSRAQVISGATGNVLHTFGVLSIGDAAGAGDVDGDGHDDVIVGDIGDATLGTSTGRATVFSGATGAVLHTFIGKATKDFFGISVAAAGDVDGDGFDDVVIGADQASTFNAGPGYVQIRSGQNGTLITELVGNSIGDRFGHSVSGAGDVDADGFDDVIIGAFGDDPAGTGSGSAVVFSIRTGQTLYAFLGSAANEALGRSVSGTGDVNNDGHADVIIGVPGESSVFPQGGSARVMSGFDGSVLHAFFGDGPGDQLGSWVSGAGEVTGDCSADLIVGAPGNSSFARVYSGSDGSTVLTLRSGVNIGPVSGAGDVNNDGLDDVIVGDPIVEVTGLPGHEHGRATVFSGPRQPSHYCVAKVNSCAGTPAIASAGLPRASAASGFVISATGAREGRLGILLYTPNGSASLPFHGGTLCVAPQGLKRGPPVIATGGTPGPSCDAVFRIDWNAFAAGAAGGNPAAFLASAGQQVNVQWWGRDSVANGSFLSDALFYSVCP
jgi:hypothetical protein